jgi:hypothetical protein
MKTATKSKPGKIKPAKKVMPVKKNGAYQKNVINANRGLKQFSRTTGGAIKLLLAADTAQPANAKLLEMWQRKTLRAIQKDDAMYKEFDKNVRKTKNGTCAFYVLQLLYKGRKTKDLQATK